MAQPPSPDSLQAPSPFLPLPPELRHIVYAMLGYPINGKLHTANIDTHFHRIFPPRRDPRTRKERSTPVHHPQDTSIAFFVFLPEVKLKSLPRLSAKVDCYPQTQSIRIPSELLGINNSMRGEILDLMFNTSEVKFSFPLSERTIRPIPMHWSNLPTTFRSLNSFELAILPSAISHMRRIHLSRYKIRRPGNSSKEDDYLVYDANSVRFLQTHCSELVELKYRPSWFGLGGSKPEEIVALAEAFGALATSCRQFRKLTISIETCVDRGSSDFVSHQFTLGAEAMREETEVEGLVMWSMELLKNSKYLMRGSES